MPEAKRKQDLTKKVMEQIHEGRVKMRPRIYFVVGSLLLGGGLAVAVGVAVFFVNLTFFRLRTYAPLGFLKFGHLGLRPFLTVFPWLPLFISVVGIVAGIAFLRRYDFSYKKGFVGVSIGFLAAVLTIGMLLSPLGFDKQARQFPPLRPFYQGRFADRDWVVGEILEVGDEEVTITTPDGSEVTIVWGKETLLPLGADFRVGEKLRAVGQWQDDNTFTAKGIGRGGMRLPMMNDRVRGLRDSRRPMRPRW